MAEAYLPRMYPCKTCGSPVVKGYVCLYCDDDNPLRGVGE